jgi:hypothetical protein
VALGGWIFLWASSGWTLVLSGLGVIGSGCAVYFIWQAVAERRERRITAGS